MKSTKTAGAPDPVLTTLQKTTGRDVPYRRLKVDRLTPNPWNPNRMTEAVRAKLVRGINLLLDSVGHLPPVIVRRNPDRSESAWQIIDGQHRWEILRDQGVKRIDAYVVDVDTKTAMMLTDTLNYLRGEPDPDLYVKYYQQLLEDHEMSAAEVAEYLPESEEEIVTMLENYDIHIDHIKVEDDVDKKASERDEADPFVEVKFLVSRSQQEIIEAELARIGALLNGKNIRGRALEFMAVNSSQTSLENLVGEPNSSTVRRKRKRKKAAA